MGNARSGRTEYGQSTVEFAVSVVVLVFILFGLIDLGRVFYYDLALTGAAREGARQASWFDAKTATNPSLDDQDIKTAVDAILQQSGLPPSTLANPATNCPSPADTNTNFNPPYQTSFYPTDVDKPLLFVCYGNDPSADYQVTPPSGNNYGMDVNVILLMSFGFTSGFLSGALGSSVHVVANAHMTVGGYPTQ